MRLGFIGVGNMGTPMARLLLEAGHQLTVYDINQEAAVALRDAGARWADNPRSLAASSEVVFTSLPGPVQVEEVVFASDNGILKALPPGGVYIDLSTNSPALSRKISEACRARGIEALDAPVSGRPPDMAIMVGGEESTFKKYRPILEIIGHKVFYLGPSGSGMVAKAINQFLIFAGFLVGAEGLLLGTKAGLDLNTLYQVLQASAGGHAVRLDPFKRPVFTGEFNRDFGGGGPLDRWVKDVGCAGEVARDIEMQTPILNIAEDLLSHAQAEGWGKQSYQVTVRIMEQLAGVELRAPN